MARDQKILLSDPSIEARFWKKVDVSSPSECWNWNGGKFKAGYGAFGVNHIAYFSNRVAFVLSSRCVVPDGMKVRHSCDNPACCNPSHLSLGSDLDNARDRVNRARSAIGSSNGSAKLTDAEVMEIRNSKSSQSDLAVRYGVSQGTISNVRTGKLWRHVA